MSSPSFLAMIVEAIGKIHNIHGASRASIANYIADNYNKNKGGIFNSNIRIAIKKGLEGNIIKQGDTQQRYKLGDNVKEFRKSLKPKPKKTKTPKKNKTVSKKKKTTSKKKKPASKKKKTASKKKKITPKRKNASKKKKTASKRKTPAKKTNSSKKKRKN